MKKYHNFKEAIESAKRVMKLQSTEVHSDTWQGINISKKPEMGMHEVLNYSIQIPIYTSDLSLLDEDIKPNSPWADEHFLERVCGYPLNPGKEWKNWPYSKSADTFRDPRGQFNHNYMERYWPLHAGCLPAAEEAPPGFIQDPISYLEEEMINNGIRGIYGDLDDLIHLLIEDPLTRQAYLPVFFPEDTGAINGGRVPCTLGYHFIMRGGFFHITYYIRSCDIIRHFRDDIYLTVRLLLWVLDKCQQKSELWKKVQPGLFSMHIVSLHCFKNDFIAL
jgi:hypothetical protein